MKNKSYLLACTIFLFCACKKEIKIREITMNDSLFQTIVIDPKDFERLDGPAKISDIATAVEYIPLQTTDSILIGQVEKLIVWNGKYYIWDKLSETIFCFDERGKYSYRLHKQGEGPEEYFRISNFTMDMKNGNICIYSDMSKAIYVYTEKGEFVKRIPTSLILTSVAIQDDFVFHYPGRFPNVAFYKEEYPKQNRYIVTKDGEYTHQQLSWVCNEKYLNVSMPNNNFSYYKDSILLVEYLRPEIYAIDSVGMLKPKYRIEFLSNIYSPSFDEDIDLEKMEQERKSGRLATLVSGFYETDNYLFFNFAYELICSAYVNKKDGTIHNMGYALVDDMNRVGLPTNLDFVDEDYMYKIDEPHGLMRENLNTDYSPYLDKIVDGIQESDNPIIVKIQLKK